MYSLWHFQIYADLIKDQCITGQNTITAIVKKGFKDSNFSVRWVISERLCLVMLLTDQQNFALREQLYCLLLKL